MISGATMPLQITEKLLFDTTACQSFDGPEPIPRVAIMPHDDKIRLHKLVIIHVHELNYLVLNKDMGITHWKSRTLQDRMSHKSVSQPCQRTHQQKIARAPEGCPTETPGRSVV